MGNRYARLKQDPETGGTLKMCPKCLIWKPFSSYRAHNKKGIGVRSYCVKCEKALRKEPKSKARAAIVKREWELRNSKRSWCAATIRYHRRSGNTVRFTPKQLDVCLGTCNCSVCNRTLTWGNKGVSMSSPSLDRVNNDSILTISNVQLLCMQCNTTKNARSMTEFVEYCKMVSDKFAHLISSVTTIPSGSRVQEDSKRVDPGSLRDVI